MTTEQDRQDTDGLSHEVPTQLMAEDTFILGLTLFDVMMTLGVFGIAGAIYFMPFMVFLPSTVRIILGCFVLVIGLPSVLLKVDGRPFMVYLMDVAQFVISTKRYTSTLSSVASDEPSAVIQAAVASRALAAAQKRKGRRVGGRLRVAHRNIRRRGIVAILPIGSRTRSQPDSVEPRTLSEDLDVASTLAQMEGGALADRTFNAPVSPGEQGVTDPATEGVSDDKR